MQVMTMTGAKGSAVRSSWRGRSGRGAVSGQLTVGAVVVSVAWSVAAPLIHPRVFWLYLVLHIAPALLSLAALVASFLEFRLRTEPAGFDVREGVGFVVPANRSFGYLVVGEVLAVAFLATQLVMIIMLADWVSADVGLSGFDYALAGVLSVASLGFGGLVALLVVAALRGRPRIELTPHGVLLAEVQGSRTIPWDALRPPLALRQVDRRTMILSVDRPELVVRRGLIRSSARHPRVALRHLRVHLWFLADAIQLYVDHPARRDGIGARSEYERLLPELGVPAGGDAAGRTGLSATRGGPPMPHR